MTVYDIKIQSLEDLPSLDGSVVVSDCDETLFEHGTTNLYPDVKEALANVGYLALVSANPDKALMRQRQDKLDADLGISADKPVWYKGKLFRDVAKYLGGLTDSLVVMGDRSLADVGVPKVIFNNHGISTLGVRVARPDLPVSVKSDYILRTGFSVGSYLVKLVRQETIFRPHNEDGHKIAKSFLTRKY